jgi:regulator of sigma E protease
MESIAVKKIEDVESFISSKPGKIIVFDIKRNNEILNLKAEARLNENKTAGYTGIGLGAMSEPVSFGLIESVRQGIMETWGFGTYIFITLINILRELFATGKTTEALSGPVGILSMVGQASQLGFVYVIRFMAILSINLAVVNALPFPALDGGRILFLLIEKIKGKPVSAETEGKFHFAGMAILLLLMVLVTYKDLGTYHVWQKITSLF